jgi:hypothetical protein
MGFKPISTLYSFNDVSKFKIIHNGTQENIKEWRISRK